VSNYTIGLLDDNPIILSGLKAYIEQIPTIQLQFTATDPTSYLKAFEQYQPSIVIMDVIMKGVDGPELFKAVRKISHDVIIVTFSDIHSINLIKGLYGTGINAFISKKESPELLFTVIDELLTTDKTRYIPAHLQQFISLKELPVFLTKREKNIANHVMNGLTNKEIANLEFISVNTVGFHKKKLFEKFNVKNIAELVREIIGQGYIQDE
jgi:DNA-binding NarL/FixJ family response regulator